MQKDTTPKPMEPFTLEEERGLVDKLDTMSVAALQNYIASAQASLGSKALAATWRPRIQFGVDHAEHALTKALAVTTRDAMAPYAAAPVAVSKLRKVNMPVPDKESEQAADEG